MINAVFFGKQYDIFTLKPLYFFGVEKTMGFQDQHKCQKSEYCQHFVFSAQKAPAIVSTHLGTLIPIGKEAAWSEAVALRATPPQKIWAAPTRILDKPMVIIMTEIGGSPSMGLIIVFSMMRQEGRHRSSRYEKGLTTCP